MKKKRQRTVRLYIDLAKKIYWRVFFRDPRKEVTLELSTASLKKAKRGYPWQCWLAQAITDAAKANASLFDHPVHYVHVTGSTIHIIERYKNGQPSHSVRYVHSFSPLVRQFDKLPKSKFLDVINGGGNLTLRMRPRKFRTGEYKGNHRSRPTGERTRTIVRGAKRRAIDAGLLPATA